MASEAIEDALRPLRLEIDTIDTSLSVLLAQRFAVAEKVAAVKAKAGAAVRAEARFQIVKESAICRGAELGLASEFVANLYDLLHDETCRREGKTIADLRIT